MATLIALSNLAKASIANSGATELSVLVSIMTYSLILILRIYFRSMRRWSIELSNRYERKAMTKASLFMYGKKECF